MHSLRTESGKFYVGKVEVNATQVFMGLGLTVGAEEGNFPDLDQLLFELIVDIHDEVKQKEGIDLINVNAYRCIVYDRREIPGQIIQYTGMPDSEDIIPGAEERKLMIDLYKVRPKEIPKYMPEQSNPDPPSN